VQAIAEPSNAPLKMTLKAALEPTGLIVSLGDDGGRSERTDVELAPSVCCSVVVTVRTGEVPVLRVDFVRLRDAIDAMTRTLDALEESHAGLTERLQPLVVSWTGGAAESYQRAQEDWYASAADMRAMLGDLRNLAATAHDNHAEAVHTNVGIWRG
jgi:WXG100 family type VII secretion target